MDRRGLVDGPDPRPVARPRPSPACRPRLHRPVRRAAVAGDVGRRPPTRVAGGRGVRRQGIGPGDVVAFQLPNWVEAALTFYAVSFLGAVVVPIVHFYGAKEVGY